LGPQQASASALPLILFISSSVCVLALMVALAIQLRARHRQDALLRRATQFRTAMCEVLLATAQTPGRSAATLEASLRRVADAVGVDYVWLWHFGDASDSLWSNARLAAGESIALSNVDELPRPLRDQLAGRSRTVAVLATPLNADGAVLGALFWVSLRSRAPWTRDQLDRFRVLSILFASDLQRKLVGEALQRNHALKDAILSSLPARIAVLDRLGTIIAVNAAWSESVWTSTGATIAPGENFLEICWAASRESFPFAAQAAAGVAEVCRGQLPEYELEYQTSGLDCDRWLLMKTTPLKRADGGAVVTVTDISERKRAELVVRENEDRFRRLADVLPVGVWMSGVDGASVYYNRTWLDLTGRPIERELGVGWLEVVHPEDRERCMGTYLRAFAERRPFSMEYRIRRFDGRYRWMLDKGVPRYDVEGAFAGYLGGAIDFTDQRDAERAMRELSGKLIAAQEDERRRIARDLHDSVGQRMALVSVRLHQLQQLLIDREDAMSILDHLWEDSEMVAREMHSLSHRLHSAKLDALGLVAAVAGECREMSEHGVLVHFSEAAVPSVSGEVALCLFRIAQEALSNVIKHSRASTARVTMTGTMNAVSLTVEDGGVGFVADERVEGLGLVSIRERVRSVGGVLSVRSAPGQGTMIAARVPVRGPAAASTNSESFDRLSRRTEQGPPLFLSDASESSPG